MLSRDSPFAGSERQSLRRSAGYSKPPAARAAPRGCSQHPTRWIERKLKEHAAGRVRRAVAEAEAVEAERARQAELQSLQDAHPSA